MKPLHQTAVTFNRRRPTGINIAPGAIRSDSEIAAELQRRTGERITSEGVRKAARRALAKIEAALATEAAL